MPNCGFPGATSASSKSRAFEKFAEPHFRWMVLLHGGILVGAALEVMMLHRPLIPALAIPMGVLFVLANLLRWWVIRTLAGHWNVEVMASSRVGVVTSGPYRWVRHPNYVAVVVELFALPMMHTAWITALAGTAANLEILRRQAGVEDGVLMADPAYRADHGDRSRDSCRDCSKRRHAMTPSDARALLEFRWKCGRARGI